MSINLDCCEKVTGVKKICNGVPYTPKGEPGYIGINCNQGGVYGEELTLEGNKRRPGFCQKNCNELGREYIPITNVNEETQEVECDCEGGKKWFKINNTHTWPYKCYPNYGNVPFVPQNGEFCYGRNQVAINPKSKPMLCNGVAYDYTQQFCKNGKLYNKPPPQVETWLQRAYQIPKP